MKLGGITFHHALTLGPICKGGRVDFTIAAPAVRQIEPGVYCVLAGKKLVYVGSYQYGVVRRWCYVRKKDFLPF